MYFKGENGKTIDPEEKADSQFLSPLSPVTGGGRGEGKQTHKHKKSKLSQTFI